MFKREYKFNFKSFLIWTVITLGIFLLVYLMYPSIVASDNVKMIDEMMKVFPPEMLKAFNMDIASMDSAYGWLKSEGFVFVLLIIGCYAGILGSNILLKEENDKTIEYLNSLPIKRTT
ncbi:MAG: multidrug ABC transporter permease, partial [Bacilli bacterium]|nr:multidrug ABC transporter permease [Bacilli bacterium]